MVRFLLVGLVLCFYHASNSQDLYDQDNITTIEVYFSQDNWDILLDNYYAADLDERLIANSFSISLSSSWPWKAK